MTNRLHVVGLAALFAFVSRVIASLTQPVEDLLLVAQREAKTCEAAVRAAHGEPVREEAIRA
jgi:hypothetical protein